MSLSPHASAEWQPQEKWDFDLGYAVDEHKRRLLDFLITELGLSPWKDLRRKFQRLQKRYMPLLEIPEGGTLEELLAQAKERIAQAEASRRKKGG